MPDLCIVCNGDQWRTVRSGSDLYRPDAGTFQLCRCDSCGHVAQIPQPSKPELDEAYSVSYSPYRPGWRQGGWPLWKILRNITTRRRMHRLKRYASGSRLLEVGSGAGDFLFAAQKAGWRVSGVEYNPDMAQILRSELKVDVRSGQLESGTWPVGEYDVVALWNVLEHVPDPLDTLLKSSSYLRKGGTLFIQIPTSCASTTGTSFGQYWALLDLPRHLNFFAQDGLSVLCKRAGLHLTVFRTFFIDTAWCHLASCWNQAATSKGKYSRMSRFGFLAGMAMCKIPRMLVDNWRGQGTEAFALAVKK
jgi:SAM-dependent methyltransferase